MARRRGRDRRRRRPGGRRLGPGFNIALEGRTVAAGGHRRERCVVVRAAVRREAGREAPGGTVRAVHRDDGKGGERKGAFGVFFLSQSSSGRKEEKKKTEKQMKY